MRCRKRKGIKDGGGGVVSSQKPLTQPLNHSKNKKRPVIRFSKKFKKQKRRD
nr:MAG TPA: hypothetical protein [Caudoviricetes sp.]